MLICQCICTETSHVASNLTADKQPQYDLLQRPLLHHIAYVVNVNILNYKK